MSLTAQAIRRNRVTGVFIVVLAAAGVAAYGDMPRQMDPGFIVRTAQIVTNFPGASPERVEQLVTERIEKVVQEIPELDNVVSQSRTGVSIVNVNVREEFKEMRPIWDNLRRKVDRIRGELPEGTIGPTVNDEFGDVYGIIYTMTSDGFSYAEMKDVGDEIRDELLRVADVAKVEILGVQPEHVFVEYNNARLAQLGLSPTALQQILEARNIILPGGDIDVEGESIALEPSGNFVSVSELGRTLIPIPGGSDVAYLEDIATITRGYEDPPGSIVRSSGAPALSFAIAMSEGGNLIELGDRVAQFFEALPGQYPHGLDFERTFFEPQTVSDRVDDFVSNVAQAVAIVLGVMLLSLGLRTGLVVAALIPTAMVITLLVMSIAGISIDQMSLAALIIALGLLVDNAIVVSESIMVRMAAGERAFDAAVSSARELQLPLLISSLTTAAAFLPIFLAESAVGEYTGVLFVVVSITLLVSWLLALTMTPLLCTAFIRPTKDKESFDTPLYRAYRAALTFVLRRRAMSLAVVVVVFLGAMQLFRFVPQIFFPPQDRGLFLAEFSLAPGTSIDRTERMAERIDAFIRKELRVGPKKTEGIEVWTDYIGATPPRFVLGYGPEPPKPSRLEMVVNATSIDVCPRLMKRLDQFAVENFPDVKTHIRYLTNGPPVDKPVQIRLSGKDPERLFEIVEQVKTKLRNTSGARNIGDDWETRVKKLVVSIDEERARRAGVTNLDVAVSLQTFLSGLETTQYREGDKVIPIMLRSVAADRRDIDRVETLNVFSQRTGESVPLRQVADVKPAWQPAEILRRDRYRTVTVESDVDADHTAADVIRVIQPWLEAQRAEWGIGYRYELGGEVESSGEANASIGEKMPIAGLIIVLLLVWQFNSLRKPILVLATIPLALIGVVVGLLVMRSYFGFMTLLGVVSLAGIVINNAIVLIDRIQIELDEFGRSPQAAILEAAQRRLRPILLTTATTVASLIPLYLGGGPMWEPMAVAIMFGLVFSTALTLGVVPLLYAILFRVPFRGAPSTG